MLYTLYKFIRTAKNENVSKSITRSGFVVLISGIAAIFSWSMERYGEAFSLQSLKITFSGIYAIFLAVQMTTLLIFFFNRLNYVFKGTQYELSKCTVRFFITLFIVLFSLWIFILGTVFIFGVVLMVLLISLFMVNVLIVICLSYMLIKKLISVYKIEQRKKEKNTILIGSITKIVILNATWILFTILDIIGITMYNAVIRNQDSNDLRHVFMAIFVGIMAIADMVANYFSVLSSFSAFSGYYQYFCKCTDNKCKKLVYWCITNKTESERRLAESGVEMNNVSDNIQTTSPITPPSEVPTTTVTITSTAA